MGFTSGKFSLTRYKLSGKVGKLNLEKLNKNFIKHQVKSLNLNSSQEIAFGWDVPREFSDDLPFGASWDLSNCQFDSGFLLRIRMETKRVSQSLLNHYFKQQLQIADSEGKPLNRQQRSELLASAKEELIQKSLPEVRYIEAAWLTEDSDVFLFSTSKRAREIFEKLFYDSFGKGLAVGLIQVTSPMLGICEDLAQVKEETKFRVKAMLSMMPTPFYSVLN